MFDYQGAKAAGYSDSEIQNYLSNQGGQSVQSAVAQTPGMSLDTSQPSTPPPSQPPTNQPQGSNPLGMLSGPVNFLTGGLSNLVGNSINQTQKNLGSIGDIQQLAKTDPQAAQQEAIQRLQETSNLASNPGSNPMSIAGGIASNIGLAGAAKDWLTRGGVSSISTNAAHDATLEGKGINWDKLVGEIHDSVTQKLGQPSEVTDALNKIIAEKTPAGIETSPETMQMSPEQLIDWRRQITNRLGSTNFLQKIFGGSNIDDKVANEVRRVVSSEVHSLAPGTVTPDKLYSFYSKLYPAVKTGIALEVAKNLGVGRILKNFIE